MISKFFSINQNLNKESNEKTLLINNNSEQEILVNNKEEIPTTSTNDKINKCTEIELDNNENIYVYHEADDIINKNIIKTSVGHLITFRYKLNKKYFNKTMDYIYSIYVKAPNKKINIYNNIEQTEYLPLYFDIDFYPNNYSLAMKNINNSILITELVKSYGNIHKRGNNIHFSSEGSVHLQPFIVNNLFVFNTSLFCNSYKNFENREIYINWLIEIIN
jgi:hypothetical protein